jgi:hypothetical protein
MRPEAEGGFGMKTIELQLITVGLDDGKQGVFIGCPLVTEETARDNGQVENIWFSNIQQVPESLSLAQLMELIRKQVCACMASIQ